ncbi:hypothetical protein [Labrys miyagiensis]|uniref:hypothetical protein n=1 Tax=Labrys miyagiensis TaxID=346912 RepID=UPI0024E0E3D3|nr:hypothetical protein [Labrys miyagiensis]
MGTDVSQYTFSLYSCVVGGGGRAGCDLLALGSTAHASIARGLSQRLAAFEALRDAALSADRLTPNGAR